MLCLRGGVEQRSRAAKPHGNWGEVKLNEKRSLIVGAEYVQSCIKIGNAADPFRVKVMENLNPQPVAIEETSDLSKH